MAYDREPQLGAVHNDLRAKLQMSERRIGEIEEQASRLSAVTTALQDELDQLEVRLGSVLQPSPPEKTSGSKEPPLLTLLGSNVRDCASRVVAAIEKLRSIRDRLEV